MPLPSRCREGTFHRRDLFPGFGGGRGGAEDPSWHQVFLHHFNLNNLPKWHILGQPFFGPHGMHICGGPCVRYLPKALPWICSTLLENFCCIRVCWNMPSEIFVTLQQVDCGKELATICRTMGSTVLRLFKSEWIVKLSPLSYPREPTVKGWSKSDKNVSSQELKYLLCSDKNSNS